MSSEKRGFVLYFDSYSSIANLSASQRGTLLSALFQYAQQICTCPENPLEAAAGFPEMEPDTRMAFCFMAGNIARDTEKWRQRQQRYKKAAIDRIKREPEWKYLQ